MRARVCIVQVSVKSSATPGRGGKGLKAADFKYSRNAYWITSRESPSVVWVEDLKPSCEAVRFYAARDKSYATTDQAYLDAADSFDSFLSRWMAKTLTDEYGQAPTKHGEVGTVFPHLLELQDLFSETKASEIWQRFASTGEQDLDGFEGEAEEERDAEEDEDAGPPSPRAAQVEWSVANIKAHPSYLEYLQYTRFENEDDR